MEPVRAEPLVINGLVVYSPPMSLLKGGLLRLTVTYSEHSPDFSWVTCRDTTLTPLWQIEDYYTPQGTLFVYDSGIPLKVGHYSLVLTLQADRTYTGKEEITLMEPTPRIVIGLPYSVYPPILLS